MGEGIEQIFHSFQDYLNKEQETREEIRLVVKEIEKYSREILLVLQNIHNEESTEENINQCLKTKLPPATGLVIPMILYDPHVVSNYCKKARELFGEVPTHYARLANVVPKNQYYRFHDQWRFVTQQLCFLVSLVIYLEVKILVTKPTVAEILGIKNNREDGFHLHLEDYLMGLLQLSSELSRFAVNSVTNGDYERPIEIARFVNDLSAGFRLLNLKNNDLRKRFDGLKYDVKKIEEVVYDLSIRGLKPSIMPSTSHETRKTDSECTDTEHGTK